MLLWQGITPNWDEAPQIPWREREHTKEEVAEATKIMLEYQQSGATAPVSMADTRYLVPWFIITKDEGPKVKKRLIADCREINKHLHTKRFRLDNLQTIFP